MTCEKVAANLITATQNLKEANAMADTDPDKPNAVTKAKERLHDANDAFNLESAKGMSCCGTASETRAASTCSVLSVFLKSTIAQLTTGEIQGNSLQSAA